MTNQLFHNSAMYHDVRQHVDAWKNACITWDHATVFRDFIHYVQDEQGAQYVQELFGNVTFFDVVSYIEKPSVISKALYPTFDHAVWEKTQFSPKTLFCALDHVQDHEWSAINNEKRFYWLKQSVHHVVFMMAQHAEAGNFRPNHQLVRHWIQLADPIISKLLQMTVLNAEQKNAIAPYIIAFPHWLTMTNPRIAWPLTRAAFANHAEYTTSSRNLVNYDRNGRTLEIMPFNHPNCAWGYADYALAQLVLEQKMQGWSTSAQKRMDVPPALRLLVECNTPQTVLNLLEYMPPGEFIIPEIQAEQLDCTV